MNKLVKPSRLAFFFIALAGLLALYVVELYQLQIVEGAAYYEESTNNVVSTVTVTAARGNILDSYGRVLVSNTECYNLKINADALFNRDDPNAFILEMLNAVDASGDTYIDELPITDSPPFEYVSDMTSIQRTRLNAYFTRHELDENTTAVELMSYFRTRYGIDNTYTAEEMRRIAGIRYEINVRYAINTSDYVFVEDASIELISTLMSMDSEVIKVETSFIREYQTQSASHLLGYIGLMNDNEYAQYVRSDGSGYSSDAKVGKDGVELAFEDWLHGTDGKAVVTSTSNGTVLSTVYTEEPVPGNQVYLTIDIQLQESVERALESGITKLQMQRDDDNLTATQLGATDDIKEDVQGGAAVVVDVKTGQPLAIASYPTYNLSTLMEDYTSLLEDDLDPLFDRALMGAYAPGSTFKPCNAIACLSENVINTSTEIDCLGVYTEYIDQGYAPECWIYSNTKGQITHGDENVTLAIRDSCNYFFYTVSDMLGITKMVQYAHNFGLGVSTGIELTETTGNMANPDTHLQYDVDNWVYGDTLQAGIGQSDSMFTPLQLAEYCATIANSGSRYSASILKSVRSYDFSENLYSNQSEVLSTVETADYNWAAVHEGMYLVANDPNGTAYTVMYGYPGGVAAKTGTSQLGEGKTNNAIFICYAPYDDPEIAIAIVVERGGAGSNLTGIARNILDAYFSLTDTNEEIETENTLLK